MMKNVLNEEIIRINNIIHGNKLLSESPIASNIIRKTIIQSIKSAIDDVVSKAIKNEFLSSGKTLIVQEILNNTSEVAFKQMTNGYGDFFKDIVSKSIKSLKDQGIGNVDENTIKAQILQELRDETSSNEIKKSVKPTIDAAKTKLDDFVEVRQFKVQPKTKPKVGPKVEPKKKFSDWLKAGKSEFDFKPNTKPSDLGIVPTSEMKAELQVLENSLNEQSKKTLLDYFKKGGKATSDGIKKLIKIGFLNKYGKLSKAKLWIWGTLLTVGSLYYIGKWSNDNPETQEDDNLIDDGGGDNNTTTTDDGKPTDGKPTDGKPTDGKPTDGKPTDGKPTDWKPTGNTTYDTEYDIPGYSAVDLDWDKLKM